MIEDFIYSAVWSSTKIPACWKHRKPNDESPQEKKKEKAFRYIFWFSVPLCSPKVWWLVQAWVPCKTWSSLGLKEAKLCRRFPVERGRDCLRFRWFVQGASSYGSSSLKTCQTHGWRKTKKTKETFQTITLATANKTDSYTGINPRLLTIFLFENWMAKKFRNAKKKNKRVQLKQRNPPHASAC